jgi:hypothetical protein
MTEKFSEQIQSILEKSHDVEKKQFFEIVKPDFLKTLEPTY